MSVEQQSYTVNDADVVENTDFPIIVANQARCRASSPYHPNFVCVGFKSDLLFMFVLFVWLGYVFKSSCRRLC